jgi:hypothetical protein
VLPGSKGRHGATCDYVCIEHFSYLCHEFVVE